VAKLDKIQLEKKEWEIEKKLIAIKYGLPEVVSLNVGGT